MTLVAMTKAVTMNLLRLFATVAIKATISITTARTAAGNHSTVKLHNKKTTSRVSIFLK